MWDDFDPLLDTLADTLRPAAGVLPDQPSDDELLAFRAAVSERFPTTGRRLVGSRRPLPMVIGAAAAAALFSTASVAAAATSVVEPVRLAETVAHEIGLPVADPNVSDAHSTLDALTAANAHHDAKRVVREIGKLRSELRRLNDDDRSALLRQIAAKAPAIAAQLSNGPAPSPAGGTATGPLGTTTLPGDSGGRGNLTKMVPTDPPTTLASDSPTTDPNGKTLPTDPPTTVPPDTTPPTDPSTTVPPDTTPSTTAPPTSTGSTDSSTTAPPTSTPTDSTTTIPPDTTTTTPQPPPDTTTSSIP